MSDCPTTGRHLTLTRAQQQVFNPYTTTALRFTVTVTNGYLIDNEIFKMVRRPIDPGDPSAVRNTFLSVCTPGDLDTLNINAPPDDDPTAYFRVDSIDLTFDTELAASEAWSNLQLEVTKLVSSLDAGDCLGEGEEVFVGSSVML